MKLERLLSIALLALSPAMVSADVLITKDGSRIETKGGWKVEGRQVIFTLPNGTLSAVRASEIDLDASRAATEQDNTPAPPPPPPPPPRPPVLVLTNDDLPEVVETDETVAQGPSAVSPSDREPVQVVSWKRSDTPDGVELRGILRNTGKTMAANISVGIQLKDEEGTVVGTANALLNSSSLLAGRSTTFRVLFNDVPDFAGEPVFTISSSGVTLGATNFAPGEQSGGSDDDGSSDASSDGAFGDDGGGDSGLGGGGDGFDDGLDDSPGFEDGSGQGDQSNSAPNQRDPSTIGYEDESVEERVESEG